MTGASIEPEIVGGDKPLSLESLQATRPGSGLAAAGLEPGRQNILCDAGLAYGARGGLAARAFAINEMLRRYEATLDSVYNFDDVILRRPRRPDHHAPAGRLGSRDGDGARRRRPDRPRDRLRLLDHQDGSAQLRAAELADLSRADLGAAAAGRPTPSLPRTEQEVQYWNKYVAEGWGEGERQADEIFLNDLGRLQRDITGMARYRVLLRAGVVANPRVATKQQAVDGGGSELRAGDRIVTITSQPGLQANAGAMARRAPLPEVSTKMLDIPSRAPSAEPELRLILMPGSIRASDGSRSPAI